MTVEATAARPRASAMFPIVPAHLSRAPPPPPPTDGDEGGGACADEFLPAGALSAPLSVRDFRAPPHQGGRAASPVRLRVDGAGALVVGRREGWLRLLPLARDPPSAALRLELRAGGRLAVRCARDVPRGHVPSLWFCDALLVPLQLPFLAPANIRGEKQYVCVSCGRQFEQPNPLKVHLALRCDRLPLEALWERLEAVLERLQNPLAAPAPAPATPFDFRLLRPTTPSPAPAPAADPGASPPLPRHPSPGARGSAFQPWTKSYSKAGDTSGSAAAAGSLRLTPAEASGAFLRSLLCPSAYNFLPPGSALGPLRLPPAPALSLDPAVASAVPAPSAPAPPPPSLTAIDPNMVSYPTHPSEMETLVSNIGSSKHGHLCIYCGKVYSRKYGLKIHIRTHTGYKPLKCKYCLRPFGDPSNLNKHIRLHAEGETPYKCEFCGKVLVRRRDLDRHIRSRHSLNGGDEDTDASNLSDEQQETGSESP